MPDPPLPPEEEGMALTSIGIFFAGFFGGLGVFFLGIGLLWFVSVYRERGGGAS